jgi:hypothetical protein
MVKQYNNLSYVGFCGLAWDLNDCLGKQCFLGDNGLWRQVQPRTFRFTRPQAGDFLHLPAASQQGAARAGQARAPAGPARRAPSLRASRLTCRSGPGHAHWRPAPRAAAPPRRLSFPAARRRVRTAVPVRSLSRPAARGRCDRSSGDRLTALPAAPLRLFSRRVSGGVAIPWERETGSRRSERSTPGAGGSCSAQVRAAGSSLSLHRRRRPAVRSGRCRATGTTEPRRIVQSGSDWSCIRHCHRPLRG